MEGLFMLAIVGIGLWFLFQILFWVFVMVAGVTSQFEESGCLGMVLGVIAVLIVLSLIF